MHHSANTGRLLSMRVRVLLAGVSTLALLAAAPPAGARSLDGSSGAAAAAVGAAGQAAQSEVQKAMRDAQEAVKRAMQAIQAQQAAQAAARSAAQLKASGVPSGLTTGGLQVAPGATPGSDLWQGANLPTSVLSGGRSKVTIEQTQAKSILTWQTFNISETTDLRFDQKGNRDWTVLNRVLDTTAPSRILGSITADGSVLVINRNGIIFGGTSQVNVGSLVASTAAISNDQFNGNGIYSAVVNGVYAPSFTGAGGAIVVEAGAQIATNTPTSVTQGGGYVLLMGTSVSNAGMITTPRGQAELAAGDSFSLRPGLSADSNLISTTRGNEILPTINTGSLSGGVSNTGFIYAQQGDITLAGSSIVQNGALVTTSTVNTRGSIHLLDSRYDIAGSIILGSNAYTAVLPELDSTDTATNTQRSTLISQSTTANASRKDPLRTEYFYNLSLLDDRLDQGRIEIVTGGTVNFQGGSLTQAQGGQVVVQASTAVNVLSGATIDVSGVTTSLAMSANNVLVNVQGTELRDSPLNRDAKEKFLYNQNVWIDANSLTLLPAGTGGYATDRYYTKGGLLEFSGYLGTTTHTIGEWTSVGGSITLQAPKVTAQAGSVLNISGGVVAYDGGYIKTANLLGADGHLYSINDASTDMKFVGIGEGFVRKNDHWGVTQVWMDPFGRNAYTSTWRDGYIVGRDAGTLQISARTSSDFAATIKADVQQGVTQTSARPSGVTDGYTLTQTQAPRAGNLVLNGGFDTEFKVNRETSGSVVFGAGPKPSGDNTGNWFDTTALNSFGLGGISVSTSSTIDVKGDLQLARGGAVSLSSTIYGPVTIAADITAPGGSVTVYGPSVTVASGATIDTRGLWTNTLLDPTNTKGLAYLNGGAISLSGTQLTVSAGSVLDASAGGAVLSTGKTTGGNGGDITLTSRLYDMVLDGSVSSYGFGKGGALTVSSYTSPMYLGSSPLVQNGQLGAAEKAPVNLTLTAPVTLARGSTAPLTTTVTITHLENGDLVPTGVASSSFSKPAVIGSAGWVVPTGMKATSTSGTTFAAGTTVPTGTSLSSITGTFPTGYTIPANSFVGGLDIPSFQLTITAGQTLQQTVVLPVGTVITVGTLLGQSASVTKLLAFDADFFQSGFSSYTLKSGVGTTVRAGTEIDVAMPVLQFTPDSAALPTGSDTRAGTRLYLPPLFAENAGKRTLTQRAGANLTLGDTTIGLQWGAITVETGSALKVDPGRSITIATDKQITVDGTLSAPGGNITIVNTAIQTQVSKTNPFTPDGLSVWIGSNAVLDAAGYSYTALDTNGSRYGVAADGGNIFLGGTYSGSLSSGFSADNVSSQAALVVVRPGARIDASGTSATFDVARTDGASLLTDARTPLKVATNGGLISLSSYYGIIVDEAAQAGGGTTPALRAAAGGAGASGGTLSIKLDTPQVPFSVQDPPATTGTTTNAGRLLTITQDYSASGLASNRAPGVVDTAMNYFRSRFSAAQIKNGQFDTAALWGYDGLVFDRNVSLSVGRSLLLKADTLFNTTANSTVSLSAPYVKIDGRTEVGVVDSGKLVPIDRPDLPVGGTLSISGALVDFTNQVLSDYATTKIASTGDMRVYGIFGAYGNLDLTAAQIYPGTSATASIGAGARRYTYSGSNNPYGLNAYLGFGAAGSVLSIHGTGATPAVPYSLFGILNLYGETILQGGIVRAPMGAVTMFGAVDLLSGSVTSVSTRGLVMQYGGTTDGVTYQADGHDPYLEYATSANFASAGLGNPAVTLGVSVNGPSFITRAGSLVDLSGGGTITGAAFITGRGGSVDTLLTALANANPGYKYSSSSNKVYAIVPGVSVAPAANTAAAKWTGAVPTVGQQITIPAGVPGLPAGTYTLLPANYALLPGAYRVEVGSRSQDALPTVMATGSGSYVLSGYQGVANTAIVDSLATKLIITPGTTVRSFSQYNETGYASFLVASAAQFGTLRNAIESDAKSLTLTLTSPSGAAANSAMSISGDVDFSAATGGYSGALVVKTNLAGFVITGPNSTQLNDGNQTTISAAAINNLDAPNVYIGLLPRGGTDGFSLTPSSTTTLIDKGAALYGEQIFIGATGTVTLAEGATVSTLGRGLTGINYAAAGLALNNYYGGAGLYATNGDIRLATTASGATSVVMKAGSAVYSEGSVTLYAAQGLSAAAGANIGTRNLALVSSALNIGSDATLDTMAASLPSGLRLSQTTLAALLSGHDGAPAVERLTLGGQSINFFGTVDLSTIDATTGKSSLAELVLSSPVIYGYGTSSDSVRITTDTLVWQGMSGTVPNRVAGLGNSGTFTVDSRNVVFGFGAKATPDTRTTFDRLMLGFQSVAFNASNGVSANGLGSISAYLTGPATASGFTPSSYAGSGGTLTFNTPVLTGAAGALLSVYGNAVSVVAPSGSASTATGGLGAELNITANTLQVASAILLPGGALSLTSTQSLIVNAGARLDLSGGSAAIYNASRDVWGGDVQLTSLAGDVVVRPGASINVSSAAADAGSVTIKAAGAALLNGKLAATGGKDANGGAIDITAASLGTGTLSSDFASLNRALTTGGFTYSRAFRLTQGNLVVGDDVAARSVSITADGGSLTIDGRIDATGAGAGAIRLAARDDLTLTSRAVLDGRGTGLVVDSYGQAIEASNRTSVELASSQGWLRLNSGAGIDLASTDGVARGRVEFNARRVTETGGDVKIDASGALGLRGIASLGVNAFWTYSPTDASGSVVQDATVSGTPSGAVGLAQIDLQNQAFYANALANADLQRRLGGLSGLGSAYHLRPGVEITSSAASGGKLTVASNLELSGYRYGPNANRNTATATYGYGEAMVLTLRASGDLAVKGRISDGFGTVAITDPNYFTLSTTQTLTTATTLSSAVYVSSSTRVPLTTLNFAITIGSATVKGGAAIPFDFKTTAQIPTVRNGWTTTANIYDTQGNLAYAAGTLIKTQIPASYTFAAGTVLPSTVTVGVYPGTVVPAGTNLATYFSGSVYLQDGSTIAAGATLPSGTILQTRFLTQDPSLTKMLAAGAQSASLRLVSGADLTSADSRSLRSLQDLSGAGNLDLTGTKLIRTGVGSLELLAGGSIVQTSNAAIYTAGTQTVLDTNDSAYHPATATGVVSPNYYPDHGGDLLIKAQKDFTGSDTNPPAQAAAQWLVMQGANELGQLGAWSVAFGDNKAYTASTNGFGTITGFGTFGGGNVTIDVGGKVTNVDATIASTGRVLANGSLLETGGGSLTVRVRGSDTGGALTQLRGDVTVETGSYGSVTPAYATKIPNDPRSIDASVAAYMSASAIGPSLYLGDAAATIEARRDVATTEVVDPGTDHMLYYYNRFTGAYYVGSGRYAYPAQGRTQSSWFSLWQPSTSLDLLALGGNVQLSSVSNGANLLPPQFRAAAASGSVYAMYPAQSNGTLYGITLEQAPAAKSVFELLAAGGIYGAGSTIKMSAADATQMTSVFRPAYAIYLNNVVVGTNTLATASNDAAYTIDPATGKQVAVSVPSYSIFGFTSDKATTNLHAGDTDPARVYAAGGDIVGVYFSLAKVSSIFASRDIVNIGEYLGTSIINANTTDVSQVVAGRDIIYTNLTVSGPGALDVTAGRNVYLGNVGSIQSNGPAYAGDLRPGASVSVTAGAASGGPNYAAVAALYLDPANLAVAGTPLVDQPGKVAKTYEKELIAWLKSRYGYEAKDAADAIGYFGKLAPEQQHVFLRQVYFAELDAGGREFNDPTSTRYKSYIRGREMIAALFPEVDKNGKPISYVGDIVMFGKSGVRSVSGGDIALLAPDGKVTIGVDGKIPAASAGIITQGAGDIDIYSKGSVQLGLSRIMTTFGGDILVWSAEGDINSGRGAKTTLVFTPPKRTYSPYGLVTLSPTVPATGAGIATLNPIPEVPPGDINLIAPLGVIDAGEAGIRVSGNVNVAALQIINAANIQVQGTSAGIPVIQAPNISGLTQATNVGAANQPTVAPKAAANDQPSVLIVEVIGYGGGDGPAENTKQRKDRRSYNSNSPFQVVGEGRMNAAAGKLLSEEEKQLLNSASTADGK